MAKFAKVGYGSNGRGLGKTEEGYTYVVNDNVRTGQVLQPIATQWQSKKKFVTTGKVHHTFKETSVKGQQAKQEFQQNENRNDDEITNVYTGKELGAKGSKVPQDGISDYTKSTRAGNVAKGMEQFPDAKFSQNAMETYDEYAKKFSQGGK